MKDHSEITIALHDCGEHTVREVKRWAMSVPSPASAPPEVRWPPGLKLVLIAIYGFVAIVIIAWLRGCL